MVTGPDSPVAEIDNGHCVRFRHQQRQTSAFRAAALARRFCPTWRYRVYGARAYRAGHQSSCLRPVLDGYPQTVRHAFPPTSGERGVPLLFLGNRATIPQDISQGQGAEVTVSGETDRGEDFLYPFLMASLLPTPWMWRRTFYEPAPTVEGGHLHPPSSTVPCASSDKP